MTLSDDAKRLERKPPPWTISRDFAGLEHLPVMRRIDVLDALEACTQRAWFAEQDGRGPVPRGET